MTEIQQNRYDQLIRRVNNIVAPGSMVADALAELFPTIDVENVPGELLALMGTDLAVGASVLTGAAGETAHIQIFNPVGSGKLITVTQVIARSSVDSIIRIGVNNTVLSSGVATQTYRDRRKDVTERPTGAMFQASLVAFVDGNWTIGAEAGVSIFLRDDNGIVVLNPGSGIEVGNISAASQMTVTFMWRERVAEPAELSF